MPRRKKNVQLLLFALPADETAQKSNEIIPFDFETQPIRVVMIKGEPWWFAVDVCRALDHTSPTKALLRLDDDEKSTLNSIQGSSGPQSHNIVNEAGLFTLILGSRKPEAKRFKRWITHEVLPSIRKTGTYSLPGTGQVERTARRLGCDRPTAEARCKNTKVNKGIHSRLATAGAKPNDYRQIHNATYRGQFGVEAPELRRLLEIRASDTPLNHMGEIPLMLNATAKAIAERTIADQATPREDQPRCYEATARELTRQGMAHLGSDYTQGVVRDDRRGKIIDVVKRGMSLN